MVAQSAPHRLRKLRLLLDLQQSAAAMRRAQPPDRPAAHDARAHAECSSSSSMAAPRNAPRSASRLLVALGDNNCGPQYRSAATARPAGRLLRSPVRQQAMAAICLDAGRADGRHLPHHLRAHLRRLLLPDFVLRPRRTVSATTSRPASACARRRRCRSTPITIPARTWRRRCRSAASPTPNCRPRSATARRSTRPAAAASRGESWADALKAIGADDTVAPGDVVVTEQNAKQLSQPRIGADGKPIRPDPRAQADRTAARNRRRRPRQRRPSPNRAKRSVRTVGPTFLPAR